MRELYGDDMGDVLRFQGYGFRVQGLGLRVTGLGFRSGKRKWELKV